MILNKKKGYFRLGNCLAYFHVFQIISTQLPNQEESFKAISTAQADMNSTVAEGQMGNAQDIENPPASEKIQILEKMYWNIL